MMKRKAYCICIYAYHIFSFSHFLSFYHFLFRELPLAILLGYICWRKFSGLLNPFCPSV